MSGHKLNNSGADGTLALGYKSETQNPKELEQFLEFIRERKINLYFEIGLYSGTTFKAVHEVLMSVWDNDPTKFMMIGCDLPTSRPAFEVCQKVVSTLPGVVVFWTSSSDTDTVEETIKEVHEWRKNNVGSQSLIFIDGDHSFSQAREDVMAYGQEFNYIAFNDVSSRTVQQNKMKHGKDIATVYHLYEGMKMFSSYSESYIEDYEAPKGRGIGILEFNGLG